MRICKVCKTKFVPKFNALEPCCANNECRYTYAIQTLKKQRLAKEKQQKAESIKQKNELKKEVTKWSEELQTEVNKIVRLIDKDLLCLARNRGGQIHAGHIYSRGSNSTIKYNLHNIHRQNAQSNHFQNDDGLLREGLQKEYGIDYFNFVSELRQTPPLKYTNKEYFEFTKKAKEIVLRLKKANLNYSLKNRILMRNKINTELGIYDKEFCVYQ